VRIARVQLPDITCLSKSSTDHGARYVLKYLLCWGSGKRTFVRQLVEFPCPGLFFRSYTEVCINKNLKSLCIPRLRHHPLLNYRRVKNWPPVWTRGTEGIVKTVRGEVGVLKEVYYDAGKSNKCFLVIDYQLQSYTGCINSPIKSFCTQLTHLLREHIGRSIEEIGDLHVSFTFSQLSDLSKIKMYKRRRHKAPSKPNILSTKPTPIFS
jgi:hypothetical protein